MGKNDKSTIIARFAKIHTWNTYIGVRTHLFILTCIFPCFHCTGINFYVNLFGSLLFYFHGKRGCCTTTSGALQGDGGLFTELDWKGHGTQWTEVSTGDVGPINARSKEMRWCGRELSWRSKWWVIHWWLYTEVKKKWKKRERERCSMTGIDLKKKNIKMERWGNM